MKYWRSYVASCALLASAACGADVTDKGAPDEEHGELELALMHGYHAGGGEEEALLSLVKAYTDAHPDVKVEVISQDFADVFNAWNTEVKSGKTAPHLFVAPNDNMGDQARQGVIADITDDVAGRLDGVSGGGLSGMSIDGRVYGIPLNQKAIGLCYNKSTLPTPPTTLEELTAALAAGKKIAIPVGAYHLFPFLTAAGAELFAMDGSCIMDGEHAAPELRDAAALVFALIHDQNALTYTNGEADPYAMASAVFSGGDADMYICGPWELKDLEGVMEANLGVAKLPGTARPLVGVDGWYVNPNLAGDERAAAVELALALTDSVSQETYAEKAGNPPARTDVTTSDPLVAVFSDLANEGFSRPQTAAFGQYWGPFGTMFTEILNAQTAEEAEAAADKACLAMNDAITASQ
jgi:arabinogalactan oligomer/maltooligosaccharide transport system substrate-binding protein